MDIDTQFLHRKIAKCLQEGRVEDVEYHRFYAWSRTKERGPEFIPYKIPKEVKAQ